MSAVRNAPEAFEAEPSDNEWIRTLSESIPVAWVDLMRGCVNASDGPVKLSPSELRLLTYLALNPRHGVLERLIEDLWPHLAQSGARNLLKVLVHRIRRKVGRTVCPCIAHGQYIPGAVAITDLERIERDVRALRRAAEPIEASLRRRLAKTRHSLGAGRPPHPGSLRSSGDSTIWNTTSRASSRKKP